MRSRRTVVVTAAVTALLMILPAAAALADSSPAVVRDGNRWLLRDSLSGGPATTSFTYGTTFDSQHMLCDWNGDGTRTPGVIREIDGRPHWLLRDTNSGGPADHGFIYGRATDRAVCGDWNGDGTQTPGVVRRLSGGLLQWHLKNSLSGGAADMTFYYGRALTLELPPTFPIVGDWNGDGTDTVGIVRGHDGGQMQWLLRDSNTGGNAQYDFVYYDGGVWGDHLELHIPMVGDWNGDGRDGPGVVRASNGSTPQWLLRNTRDAGTADHNFRYGRFLDLLMEWR